MRQMSSGELVPILGIDGDFRTVDQSSIDAVLRGAEQIKQLDPHSTEFVAAHIYPDPKNGEQFQAFNLFTVKTPDSYQTRLEIPFEDGLVTMHAMLGRTAIKLEHNSVLPYPGRILDGLLRSSGLSIPMQRIIGAVQEFADKDEDINRAQYMASWLGAWDYMLSDGANRMYSTKVVTDQFALTAILPYAEDRLNLAQVPGTMLRFSVPDTLGALLQSNDGLLEGVYRDLTITDIPDQVEVPGFFYRQHLTSEAIIELVERGVLEPGEAPQFQVLHTEIKDPESITTRHVAFAETEEVADLLVEDAEKEAVLGVVQSRSLDTKYLGKLAQHLSKAASL